MWVGVKLAGLGMGAIAIVGCGGVNSQKVADQIRQDITTNGGTSVKAVTCPGGVKPEAGKSFACIGEMDNGYTFTITVQQQDDKGTFTWDVPHAKGLINVPKLESTIQETLTTELGTKPTIACGDTYKALNPGESFECKLSYKRLQPAPRPTKPAKGKPAPAAKPVEITQTEKINVTTDSNGNVSWQRIPPRLTAAPHNNASRTATASAQ